MGQGRFAQLWGRGDRLRGALLWLLPRQVGGTRPPPGCRLWATTGGAQGRTGGGRLGEGTQAPTQRASGGGGRPPGGAHPQVPALTKGPEEQQGGED